MSYARDIGEGGPRYIQWSARTANRPHSTPSHSPVNRRAGPAADLPLFDDDVLRIVPGSHLRPATDAEDSVLRRESDWGKTHCHASLPGELHVQLRAGDGVACECSERPCALCSPLISHRLLPTDVSPTILHWGSSYTPRMRRTIHGGFSVGMTSVCRPALLRHLSGSALEKFERWHARSQHLVELEEATLRAALSGSQEQYRAAMAELVPGARGTHGRRHSTVLLSKAARRIKAINEHPQLRQALAEAVESSGGLSLLPEMREGQGLVEPEGYVEETDDPFLLRNHPTTCVLRQACFLIRRLCDVR
jgi:hypothetical protein